MLCNSEKVETKVSTITRDDEQTLHEHEQGIELNLIKSFFLFLSQH